MNHVYYDLKTDSIVVGIVKKNFTTYVQYKEGHWLEVQLVKLFELTYIGEL